MKRTLAAVAAGLVGAGSAGAADDNPLVAERWRTRPLVVVAATADDPMPARVEAALRQAPAKAAFAEREMVLYTVVAGQGRRGDRPLSPAATRALLRALGASERGPATAYLVGKDGGVKLAERDPVSLDAIFGVIDQMPMRAGSVR